jgi:hypothetical protein
MDYFLKSLQKRAPIDQKELQQQLLQLLKEFEERKVEEKKEPVPSQTQDSPQHRTGSWRKAAVSLGRARGSVILSENWANASKETAVQGKISFSPFLTKTRRYDEDQLSEDSEDEDDSVEWQSDISVIKSIKGKWPALTCVKSNGSLLVGGTAEGPIVVFNTAWNCELDKIEENDDLSHICSIEDEDGKVKQTAILDGKMLEAHKERITCLRLNGGHMFSGANDCQARLWDMEKMHSVNTFEGHRDGITWVEMKGFDNAALLSRRLATGGSDGLIRVWDHRTGKADPALLKHEGSVTSVKFDPADENFLVSCSRDATVKVPKGFLPW